MCQDNESSSLCSSSLLTVPLIALPRDDHPQLLGENLDFISLKKCGTGNQTQVLQQAKQTLYR
jgi:hypothetical protein